LDGSLGFPIFLRTRRSALAALVAAAALPGLGGCRGDAVVAKINDEPIGLKEFDRQLRILKSLRPDTVVNEATRREVLEQMVKQQLLADEAKKAGLDQDPGIQASIQQQREAVRAELNETIENAKAQLDQLDRAVEQKVLIERLLALRSASVSVSEAEIKKAYASRSAQVGAPPPLKQIHEQLRQQLLLEKLVEAAKPANKIELYPEIAAQGGLE
jgi:hypothetical protein